MADIKSMDEEREKKRVDDEFNYYKDSVNRLIVKEAIPPDIIADIFSQQAEKYRNDDTFLHIMWVYINVIRYINEKYFDEMYGCKDFRRCEELLLQYIKRSGVPIG